MGKQCWLLLHLSLCNVILTLPFASEDVNHIALRKMLCLRLCV